MDSDSSRCSDNRYFFDSVLDHIGFDVNNLQEFLKKLDAAGVKIDRPYTPNPLTGDGLAFICDPWGTYIELNERKKPL